MFDAHIGHSTDNTTEAGMEMMGKKRREKKKGKYLRCDFVGRVSAHHVLNNQGASRMLVHPSVESQDIVLENDNGVAVGNHALDNPLREDPVTVHDCEEKEKATMSAGTRLGMSMARRGWQIRGSEKTSIAEKNGLLLMLAVMSDLGNLSKGSNENGNGGNTGSGRRSERDRYEQATCTHY